MNDSHIKQLTLKSAFALWESHSKFLKFQTKETLLKLINFEIKVDWDSTLLPVSSKIVNSHTLRDNYSKNDGIYAYETIENTNNINYNEMQADSKASNHVLSFLILNTIIVLIVLE